MTVHPRTLALFYRRHLRVQPVRELMAVAGVAAGVGLLFAVQITSSSITGAFEQVVHGVAGRATIEVAARSPEGFPESVTEQVAAVPGVHMAAPVLSAQVTVAGPAGSRPLTLLGADERLAALGGRLISRLESYAEASRQGLLVLTAPTARAIGARVGTSVALQVGASTHHLAVDAVVPTSQLGPLAESPVAATLLPIAQNLLGLQGRVTRVLVEPDPREEANVRRALEERFGATLNVRSVDSEGRLLAAAAKPEVELTALFSAICLVVGLILAYNALLLASDERKAFIAFLVRLGTPDSVIVASLAFDAFVLGIAGCILGLLAGDAISLIAYRAPPGYLAAAFPITEQRVLTLHTILLALAAGMFAAFAAAALPAITVLRSGGEDPTAANRESSPTSRARFGDHAVFACGAALLCIAVATALLAPALTVPCLVVFAAGLVLCLPMTVRHAVKLVHGLARRTGDAPARLATAELQTAPTRSVALVATGTIAVFLLVTIGGAITDVQRAVRAGAGQTGANAPLWIKPGGAANVYSTQPFPFAETQRRLERVPAVNLVLPFRQSFLDLPNRRMWVIGIPPQTSNPVPQRQLMEGPAATVAQRLREGDWAIISQVISSELHLHIGQHFQLPTPSGAASFRLAATVSNYGWMSGTVLLNANDYARLWHSTRAGELAVTLKPGVSVAQGKRAVQRALGPNSALTVQTAAERQTQVTNVLANTLARLKQTSIIVLLAAVATVIAMMISAIWQRRGRLDALMAIGMSTGQLARLVFYETGCVLLCGCILGIASGLAGQYLTDNWLIDTTGSPVAFNPAWQFGLRTLLVAVAISLAAAAIAVIRTVGFQPKAAFSTE